MEGFSVVGQSTDTHVSQYVGDDSVGFRDRFRALLGEMQLLKDKLKTPLITHASSLLCVGYDNWIQKYLLMVDKKGLTLDVRSISFNLDQRSTWTPQETCDARNVANVISSRTSASFGWKRYGLLSLFAGPSMEISRICKCLDEMHQTVALLANVVQDALAVVATAVVLLSYVYLYLTGCGGWGGSKADSSGSLDYRDTYIAIVLFRGGYVWIKFRDVASTKPIPGKAVQLIETPRKDGRIRKKYEPRFKPHKENGMSFSWMYLGRFDSYADAEVVYRMAASCYHCGKDYGTPLDLAGDGREYFTIIPEFTAEEKTLSGREKQELVKERVKELYERYKTKKDALNLPPTLRGASLEQELQNRRLQSDILSEQQQKEDLACQLQQCQHLQQAQQFQIQILQSQVEDVMRQLQHLQQAAQFQVPNLQPLLQHLQQAAQFQVPNLQPQPQYFQQVAQFQVPNLQPELQLCQDQQPGDELFTVAEVSAILNMEPLPEASFVTDSLFFGGGDPTDG